MINRTQVICNMTDVLIGSLGTMNKSVRSITLVSLKLLKDSVSRINLAAWLPKRKSRKGRSSYSTTSMFLAYLLKIRQFIEFDTRLVKDLHEHESYQRFCGYNHTDIPSHDTFSRFFRKLTPKLLQRIFLKIDRQLAALGIFDDDELASDATDMLSNQRN